MESISTYVFCVRSSTNSISGFKYKHVNSIFLE
jgi:hypothetical protein